MRLSAVSILGLVLALGCASAYQDTYDREMERLGDERRVAEAHERSAHAEAQKYAAVVYFDVGSSAIREDGFRELGWFVDQLRPYPKAIVEVRGFADTTGGDAVNQRLSHERAESVARYLVSRGIDSQRIVALGFSSEFPADSNVTAEGRRKNRRVEVTIR